MVESAAMNMQAAGPRRYTDLVSLGSFQLIVTFPFWPGALDIIQYSLDLGVGKHSGKGGHVGFIPGSDGLEAFLDYAEQLLVRVMPGVSRLSVRWGRQSAVGQPSHPIWLPFQISTMAACTALLIYRFAVNTLSSRLWRKEDNYSKYDYGPKGAHDFPPSMLERS